MRIIISIKYLPKTVDVEIKTDRALSESRSCCELGRTQIVKWTTEGAMKGFSRVFRDEKAYVSCQEYVSILISVRIFRKTRWHRGYKFYARP